MEHCSAQWNRAICKEGFLKQSIIETVGCVCAYYLCIFRKAMGIVKYPHILNCEYRLSKRLPSCFLPVLLFNYMIPYIWMTLCSCLLPPASALTHTETCTVHFLITPSSTCIVDRNVTILASFDTAKPQKLYAHTRK